MKLLRYIHYFFYVGFNWGWRIAFEITRQEIKGEKKYGINTTGADELKQLSKKGIDISHATMYMPVSYKLLEQSLGHLPGTHIHFLDLGCGKGRALCIAAFHGFKKVTGVDFSASFCNEALSNLSSLRKTAPCCTYNVVQQDAACYDIPADVDCIFLFNPFDEIIMTEVLNNIVESLQKTPRDLYVMYANPQHKSLFIAAHFTEIYYRKSMKQFEISILKNRR